MFHRFFIGYLISPLRLNFLVQSNPFSEKQLSKIDHKHRRRCSTPLVIRDRQIKATTRGSYTPPGVCRTKFKTCCWMRSNWDSHLWLGGGYKCANCWEVCTKAEPSLRWKPTGTPNTCSRSARAPSLQKESPARHTNILSYAERNTAQQ